MGRDGSIRRFKGMEPRRRWRKGLGFLLPIRVEGRPEELGEGREVDLDVLRCGGSWKGEGTWRGQERNIWKVKLACES